MFIMRGYRLKNVKLWRLRHASCLTKDLAIQEGKDEEN